jgi:hypothetical protein
MLYYNSHSQDFPALQAPTNTWLDRIGMLGAGVCALHCMAMPVLLLSMPLSAFSIASRGTWRHELAHWVLRLHGYEKLLVASALLLALVSLALGWRRHRRWSPGLIAALAALSLGCGLLLRMPLLLHLVLLLAGGLLLGVAHWLNLVSARSCAFDRL